MLVIPVFFNSKVISPLQMCLKLKPELQDTTNSSLQQSGWNVYLCFKESASNTFEAASLGDRRVVSAWKNFKACLSNSRENI